MNEKLLTKLSLTESSKSAYYHETLTDQLNIGIRGLEIDVNARKSGDDIVFNTFHTLLDSRTCALSFDLALEELKLWSDANPEHIPITVLIEVKELAITPLLGNSLEVINALDDTIGEILGDKVLTPSEIMGTHSTFGAMRGVNDWIRLDEAKGQIMVVLHKSDMTYAYVNQDTSMDTFNMVPSFYYDDLEEYSDFASVLLMNDPDDDRIPTAIAANCIVRSRADTYPLPSEDYMKVDGLVAQGVNMITTDYPVRTVERVSGEYVAQLDTEGHTIIFVG